MRRLIRNSLRYEQSTFFVCFGFVVYRSTICDPLTIGDVSNVKHVLYFQASKKKLLLRANKILTRYNVILLKGNSHQILVSEVSLPGIEVLTEKLLLVPKILGRLGKEN